MNIQLITPYGGLGRSRIEFAAQVTDFGRTVSIAGFVGKGEFARCALMPVELKFDADLDATDCTVEPTLKLSERSAQSLLDALIAAGLRPSSPANESKVIEVMRGHLGDLRALVFKKTPRDLDEMTLTPRNLDSQF